MFSSLRAFLNRHKRKIIAGSLIVGGAIVLTKYARIKIEEWQEKKTKEFLDRTRKNQHFESTERICNQTILSLYKTLTEEILKQLSTDELVAKLKSSPENRVEIWNDIKIISFSRVTSFIYATVLLVAILRVQLNILGGYLFKNKECISGEFQEKYLQLCQIFLNEGLSEIIKNIQQKVKHVVVKFDLKQKMSLQDVELLFWSIQSQLSSDLNDPILRVYDFLINDTSKVEMEQNELLKKILNETCDLLESDELRNVCSSNVSRGFSCLIDVISEFYTSSGASSEIVNSDASNSTSCTFINPNKTQIPMAKLIPIINGILSNTQASDSKNFSFNLIHQLILNDQFKILGANIYEAFCDDQ